MIRTIGGNLWRIRVDRLMPLWEVRGNSYLIDEGRAADIWEFRRMAVKSPGNNE